MQLLMAVLICLLVLLAGVFGFVVYSDDPKWIFKGLGVGTTSPKYEALKFLGIGMGGTLVALQAVMSYRRAKALEDSVRHAEHGLRQERMKNAIEHLGHESDSVRMGGAYELFHLARDTQGQDAETLRQTVLDILCAHIRWTTGKYDYQKMHKWEPSLEVQSLLTLLFAQKHDVFNNLCINLRGSWLNGADLSFARLEEAILSKAHLKRVDFSFANLRGAWLDDTHLHGADLSHAMLPDAMLDHSRLYGACLNEANLQMVSFDNARLQGAKLWGADLREAEGIEACLQGAFLRKAILKGTSLVRAQLQGASFWETYLQEAILTGAHLHGVESLHGVTNQNVNIAGSFAQRMRESIGQASDLTGAIFAAELSQEGVDFITGAYTEEEAEKWIVEYEEAMSEIPEKDS